MGWRGGGGLGVRGVSLMCLRLLQPEETRLFVLTGDQSAPTD